MLVSSKKTLIFIVLLIIAIISLLILRLSRPSPPPPPEPSIYLPFPRLSQESVATQTIVFSDPSPLSPTQASYYTATQPPITQELFNQLALSLGITTETQVINDPIQGTFYTSTTPQKNLTLVPSAAALNYFYDIPPSSNGTFPSPQLINQIIQDFISYLPPAWQPQNTKIVSQQYLKISGGEFISATETSAHILAISLATQPNFLNQSHPPPDLSIQLTRAGDIRSFSFTLPLQLTPSQPYPLKTKADIIAAFIPEAAFAGDMAIADLKQIDRFVIDQITLNYRLPSVQENLVHPIFVLTGTIYFDANEKPATAIIPAIQSNYLLVP